MKAARAPYAYDRSALVVTCRTCHVSQPNVLPEQAGPWHAGHLAYCEGPPGANRPTATVLPFRPRDAQSPQTGT